MLLMLLEFSNNYLYLHLCVFILHHLSSFVISSLPDYYLLTVFYPPPIYFFVLSISLLSTSLCLRSVLVYGCAPLASAAPVFGSSANESRAFFSHLALAHCS